VKETDGSLSIGTVYNYAIGGVCRQKKREHITKLRLDKVIVIYALIFLS